VPAIAIPIKPYEGYQTQIPGPDGSSAPRVWVGSTSLTLPAGVYKVELYADRLRSGGTFLAAYADHIGLVAVLLFDKDNKLLIGCSLKSIF
jgi:hypothetical protein